MSALLYVMPVFSVWFAFKVPSGVGFIDNIYNCSNNSGNALMFILLPSELKLFLQSKRKAKKRNRLNAKMLEQQELMNQQNNGSQGSASNRVNYSDETEDCHVQSLMHIIVNY